MSASYKPGDSATAEFCTARFDTGAATNGDSLPVGTLNRNGTDDGAVTVTVTNLDAGRYKAAFTIPATYVAGDELNLSVAATVNSVAGKGVVWRTRLGVGVVRSSTATAGAAGSITLDASASATTDFYKGTWIVLIAGTGAGQVRLCTAYNGSTKVATVAPNWATNPANDSVFAVLPAAGADVQAWLGTVPATPTTAGVPAVDTKYLFGSILSEAAAGRLAGGFVTAFNVATPAWTVASVNQTGDSFARIGATGSGLTSLATAANLAVVAGYVDTEIADIQSRLPAALVGGRMDASVGAMATNTLTAAALATDAVTEIQAGLSTYAGGDTAGTTTLLSRVTAAVALASVCTEVRLAHLDADVSSRLAAGSYTAPPSAATISTQVASDLALAHGAGSWATATGFAVAGSAMTLTSGERNSVADAVLSRSASNVEDTADEHSLCSVILGSLESTVVGTVWTLYKTDGSTVYLVKTLTTDPAADAITGVS